MTGDHFGDRGSDGGGQRSIDDALGGEHATAAWAGGEGGADEPAAGLGDDEQERDERPVEELVPPQWLRIPLPP